MVGRVVQATMDMVSGVARERKEVRALWARPNLGRVIGMGGERPAVRLFSHLPFLTPDWGGTTAKKKAT